MKWSDEAVEAAAKALWPYFPKEKRPALQRRLARKGLNAAAAVQFKERGKK